MDAKVSTECICCGKKDIVYITPNRSIGNYLSLMKARMGYICSFCKGESSSNKRTTYKKVYERIISMLEKTELEAVLFNKNMNCLKSDGKLARSVKYMHVYDKRREASSQIISIYFDQDCVLGSNLNASPYYEVYFSGDIARYIEGSEEELVGYIEAIIGNYCDIKK